MLKVVFARPSLGPSTPLISLVSLASLLPLCGQVNISNFNLVMESDMGTFAPVALQFTGSPAARKVGT